MTLVIARRAGDALMLFADTKLTPESDQKWSLTCQTNKLVTIDQDWLVAFAGNSYVADRALKVIERLSSKNFGLLSETLLTAHRNSLQAASGTDFLLVNLQSQSIYKIFDGALVRQNGPLTWLGSKNAFEKFQELNHLGPNQSHALLKDSSIGGSNGFDIAPQVLDQKRKDVERRIDRIFKALIDDSSSPEIGGFPVSLIVHEGMARYWPRAGRILAVPPGGLPSDFLRDPVFGNAAFGDFQYDILTGWDATDNFLAIYFRAIQKALVFRRWEEGIPYAKMVDDLSPDDVKK